jgi:anti-sigma28 factor (negative regulator of flagellin synthesis)
MGEAAPVADTGAPEGRDGAAGVTDRVQLSEAARLRQRLKAEVGDPTETAAERVAALRAQVTTQSYAPGPRAVAERLLGELAADLLV